MMTNQPHRITGDEGRPTLFTRDPVTNKEMTLAFGYYEGEPTAALLVEGSDEPVAFLPAEFLSIAIHQGWDMVCPDCGPTE